MCLKSKLLKVFTISIALILLTSCGPTEVKEAADCAITFTYVDLDGNIYFSDLCGNKTTQITFDGKENSPYRILKSTPILTDEHKILALNGAQLYLVNLQQFTTDQIDFAESAQLSPNGSFILLLYGGEIKVYDSKESNKIFQTSGYAPSWVDNSRILFVSTEYTGDIPRYYTAKIQDIASAESFTSGSIETFGSPPKSSGSTEDGKYAFFYSPVGEIAKNFIVVDINHKKSLENSYIRLQTISSVEWENNKNRLFLCYGHITYLAPEISAEYRELLDQDCWIGTEISRDVKGKYYSYLSSDIETIRIVNTENNNSNNINWFDKKPGGGVVLGPYLSPNGAYISLVFQNKISIYAVNGDLVLNVNGMDFIW